MLKLAIRGKLEQYTALVDKAAGLAVATIVRRFTTQLKNAIRREILSAGLGEKIANTIRSEAWPARGGSLGAHGRVWSKAIYKRPGGLIDLITVFEEGATIRASGQNFLPIPVNVGKSPVDLRRNAIPSDFPEGTFGVKPTLRPGVFVLYWKHDPDRIAFILVRSTVIRSRLNLAPVHARLEARFDAALGAEFERQIANAGRRAA